MSSEKNNLRPVSDQEILEIMDELKIALSLLHELFKKKEHEPPVDPYRIFFGDEKKDNKF